LAALLAAVLPAGARAACGNGLINPVVIENCQSNQADWSSQWRVDRQKFVYDTRVLAGYASSESVNHGQAIHFYIRAPQSPPGVRIDFYRLGWYGGTGGRRVASVELAAAAPQPDCRWQAAATVNAYLSCNNWQVSYSLGVPGSWTSGIYLAAIRSNAVPPPQGTNAPQAYAHDVMFVVRDDERRADFIYQRPVATEQAYNSAAYGPGLYDTQTVNRHKVPVAKASFERPSDTLDNLQFYRFELPFIFWVESEGYDTVYTTDIDIHERTTALANRYKAFLISGHSEYWSRPMYDAVQAARDSGVHLGFFGGDTLYWQMRLEDETAPAGDATHQARDRVMVVFRYPFPPDARGRGDPNPDPALQTIYWREFPLLRDEEALVGVHFTQPLACPQHVAAWASRGDPTSGPVLLSAPQPLVVAAANSWPFDGTGLQNGERIEHVYGQEADAFESPLAGTSCGRRATTPPPRAPAYRAGTLQILASSPFNKIMVRPPVVTTQPTVVPVNSVIYQACSGAWVFGAGDIMWGNVLAGSFVLTTDYHDPRLQQLSRNILDVFAGLKTVPAGGDCVASWPAQLAPALQALGD
jgi:hypothetical protein